MSGSALFCLRIRTEESCATKCTEVTEGEDVTKDLPYTQMV